MIADSVRIARDHLIPLLGKDFPVGTRTFGLAFNSDETDEFRQADADLAEGEARHIADAGETHYGLREGEPNTRVSTHS